jgi:protein phosphatase
LAVHRGRGLGLPEPCVVVLIGAAGSGKSTLAARLFAPDQVLSSDAYRGLVSGDESNQAATKVAFRILHRELERRLIAGRIAVIDATNVTTHARRSVIRVAARHSVPAIAIILDLEPALVHARNATRTGRIVPSDAVAAQLRELARSLRRNALATEGFAAIHHLRTPAEVDALSLGSMAASGGSRTS